MTSHHSVTLENLDAMMADGDFELDIREGDHAGDRAGASGAAPPPILFT